MVKFRGKPKPRKAAAPEQPEVHAYSAPRKLNPFGALNNATRRQKLIIGIAALLIIVVALGSYTISHVNNNAKYGETLPDTQTYYSDRIKQLESQPPANSSTVRQKAEYYDMIAGSYVAKGDYKNAVEYMEKIEDTMPSYFDYHDYILLASYYHQLNDRTNAGLALDRATQALPQTDSPSELPHEDLVKLIDKYRKEYAS